MATAAASVSAVLVLVGLAVLLWWQRRPGARDTEHALADDLVEAQTAT